MRNLPHFASYLFTFILLFSISSCVQKQKSIPSIPTKVPVPEQPVVYNTVSVGKFVGSSKHTSLAWHRATMRNYTVRGKRYHPTGVYKGELMHGISSWYGPNFHGKRTSNGEIYNMHARTAAHKTWPMDTMVRVTNLQNGKSTEVRINDRGPYVRGRIIDCSYKAGKELGLDKMGIARVRVEVLGMAGRKLPSRALSKKRLVIKKKAMLKKKVPSKKMFADDSHIGLQIGAFILRKNAKRVAKKYAHQYKTILKSSITNDGTVVYRVILKNFSSKAAALWFKKKNNLGKAIVVST